MHTNPAKNVGFSSTTSAGVKTTVEASALIAVIHQPLTTQMKRRWYMSNIKYLPDSTTYIPCTTCKSILPHRILFQGWCTTAHALCPSCMIDSYWQYTDHAQLSHAYLPHISRSNYQHSTRDI